MTSLALEIDRYVETHPATAEQVEVTLLRRGVLRTEERKYQDPVTAFAALAFESPRKNLEDYCNRIRDFLELRGLPSDRQPLWVQINNEDWKQASATNPGLPQPGQRIRHARWIARVERLTEPLSPEQLAGKLLWTLTDLLKRKGIDKDLWHISRFAHQHSRFVLSGINELACLGLSGRKARASGPKAMRTRAIKVAAVVAACTNECWADHPELRGVANRTAEVIRPELNKRLLSQRLLARGKQGLSTKTIGDHIRKNIGV